MDQALRVRQRGVRRVTALILLIGIGVLAWALYSPERRRARAVGRLALGDTMAQVTQQLGRPGAVCGSNNLTHLRRSLPSDWPPVSVERAMERMQAETAQRWVYPLDSGQSAGCTMRSGTTEVGIGRDGRILWYVSLTGRTVVELPPGFTTVPEQTNDTTPP